MAGIAKFFNWKSALIWHTVFFSLALLQQDFYLGMLWTVINTFVFLLLLRSVYGKEEDKQSNRGMAWYAYLLSIFTDFISLCVYGQWTADMEYFSTTFVLIAAVFALLPKPIFTFFLLKLLEVQGFNIKKGLNLRKSTIASHDDYQGFDALDNNDNTNNGYSGPQNNDNPDIIIQDNNLQSQHQDQPVVISNNQRPNEDTNTSLMDQPNDYDVFTPPGQ